MTDAARDVVVLGEALVDIVRTPGGAAESPGGSPANVAVALGRLGRAVTLVTRLGADARGRAVRSWLEESDVDVEVAAIADRTSVADAVIGESGDASYTFDIEWRLPDPLELPPARVVHTGSIAAYRSPGADAVLDAVERARSRAVVTFDPNVRPALAGERKTARARIERLVCAADVVKASDEDIEWLYPGTTVERVARAWSALGATLVVVTLGSRGALAAGGSGIVRMPATPVSVVDTVGAGDTFMGTLIDAVLDLGDDAASIREGVASLDERAIERALARSAAAAAVTVSRVGMDPPRRRELHAVLQGKGL